MCRYVGLGGLGALAYMRVGLWPALGAWGLLACPEGPGGLCVGLGPYLWGLGACVGLCVVLSV